MTRSRGPFSSDLERIALSPADRASLGAQLDAGGQRLPERYVIANPNASDLLLERRWPAGHFQRLLAMLVDRGHHPVLVGAPSERPHVTEIWQGLPDAVRERTINLAGVIGLPELFVLIDGAGASSPMTPARCTWRSR